MKFKTLLLIFIMFFNTKVFSGDHVNNGGGLAEQRVTYAYLNIKQYINLCLNSDECFLNLKEKEVLIFIKTHLHLEYKNKKQLIFISEKKVPGTFIIQGEYKIAKTGDQIASPIIFNIDLLYSSKGNPISLARAMAVLIHEFGHHAHHLIEVQNHHTFLDRIGNKVALIYNEFKLTTPLSAAHKKVQINVLNSLKENSYPNLLLQVNDDLIDLTSQLKEKLRCTKMLLPLGIIIKSGKPSSANLHNLHWTKIKEKSHSWNFKIVGNLSNFCEDQNKIISLIKQFKIEISFKAKKKIIGNKVELYLKRDSIQIKQIYDPWIKFFNIPLI